jgi:Raf kinase inhibitor-like YbhB/YbcL family protein
MKIYSPAFDEGSLIPSLYTCDGKNLSIPLRWQDIPANAQSLALIMDDPDAPMGTWVHWVLYNLPTKLEELAEGLPADKFLPGGGIQGHNTSLKTGYSGPCPPNGTHRYFFKLYALDCTLENKTDLTKAKLFKAMEGHILAEAQMFGVYQRK